MTPRFTKPVVETGIFNDEAGQVAVRLLQREHAAVVRKVKGMRKDGAEFGSENYGCNKACDDLIAWLNERGR